MGVAMSNETDFVLQFKHPSREYLQKAQEYMEEKRKSWQAREKIGGSVKTLLEKIGVKRPNEVVSWGFGFGEIREDNEGFALHATARANQNIRNLHITGKDGELADVLSNFPQLKIHGVFKDKYGHGTVHQSEQKYEYKGEDGGETIADMDSS
jgi:hypothetical protein